MTVCTAGYHDGMRQLLVIPIARSEFMNCPPSLRFPPLREGNQAARPFGSPCVQGEP